MTRNRSRRLAAQVAVLSAVLAAPVAALGWAAASHAYIAKHTEKRADQVTANERCNRLYGANAVDLFNAVFTPAGQLMAAVLHDPTSAVSALPWDVAQTEAEAAFAFGFASHNEAWGTDRTAHWDAVTLGLEEGYVISRARDLANVLRPQIMPLVGDEATLQLVSHVLIEHAIDLQIAAREPSIGYDMMASTECPAPAGVDLLVTALVPEYAKFMDPALAEKMIRGVEPAFRFGLLTNGWALTQPDATRLMAFAIAEQARSFLPPPLPENDVLVPLIEGALQYGMGLVAPDFQAELDATVGWVNGQMSARKITP